MLSAGCKVHSEVPRSNTWGQICRKYAGQLYPGGEIPLRVLTVLVAMSVDASVGVRDSKTDREIDV